MELCVIFIDPLHSHFSTEPSTFLTFFHYISIGANYMCACVSCGIYLIEIYNQCLEIDVLFDALCGFVSQSHHGAGYMELCLSPLPPLSAIYK